jgi:hypothetical protein
MLLQPLRYELLYIGLAGSNIFAAFLLYELRKVKKQRQPAIHNEARVAVPFQIALYLRRQPAGTNPVNGCRLNVIIFKHETLHSEISDGGP